MRANVGANVGANQKKKNQNFEKTLKFNFKSILKLVHFLNFIDFSHTACYKVKPDADRPQLFH